ncbi:hypothetical protein HID58_026074 [Brassica napus]|uniref:Uncharacterized protein n=1 Tax=Brassica napus TaxID=3708 RepID=A0ABQ8CMW4_BRANA|nr:hypothetical protein HID58_026074 [Brassica napus]
MGSVGEVSGGGFRCGSDDLRGYGGRRGEEQKTVLWAARNFSSKKICLLYVHRPAWPASCNLLMNHD